MHPVVHGTLDEGRQPATLFDVQGHVHSVPGLTVTAERWQASGALLGQHLETGSEQVVRRVSLHLEHLAAFAGHPQVAVHAEIEPAAKVRLEVERQVLQSAELPAAAVQLVASPRVAFLHDGRAEIEVVVTFELQLREPASWEQVLNEYVLPLRDLLVVLLDQAVAVVKVSVHTGPRPAQAQVLTPMERPLQPPTRTVFVDDFVRPAAGLPGGFNAALSAWWQVRHDAALSVRELVDALQAPHVAVQDRLLAYVRAAGPLLVKADRDAAVAAADAEDAEWRARVAASLPEEFRAGVLARLGPKPANERHRLVELLRSLGLPRSGSPAATSPSSRTASWPPATSSPIPAAALHDGCWRARRCRRHRGAGLVRAGGAAAPNGAQCHRAGADAPGDEPGGAQRQ